MHPRKKLQYVSSHFQDAARDLRLNSTSRLWLKAVKRLFNCQARLPPAELSPHVTTSLQLSSICISFSHFPLHLGLLHLVHHALSPLAPALPFIFPMADVSIYPLAINAWRHRWYCNDDCTIEDDSLERRGQW